MDLQRLRINDLFEAKFHYEGCDVAIYFYTSSTDCSMMFTAGYFNPEALSDMLAQVLGLDEDFAEDIGFIGVISGDNRLKVKKCIELASNAVKCRVKTFKEGAKSVKNIEAMTIEEVCEKFFPDRLEKKGEKEEPPPKSSPWRFRRIRRPPKNDLVDLTICEEEGSADNESVCSSVFFETICSELSWVDGLSDENIGEETLQKLRKPPKDKELLKKFMKTVDYDKIIDPDEYQVETRSEEELMEEFDVITAKMLQKQYDDDEQRDRLQLEENNGKKTPANLQVFRDDSKVTRRSGREHSNQPSLLDYFDADYNKTASTSKSFQQTGNESSSRNEPQLGRGIDPKKGVILGGSQIKSKLLTQEEIQNAKKASSVPQFQKKQISFSSSEDVVTTSPKLPPQYTIPKKTRHSPEKQSQSVIEKSPVGRILSRPSINSRTTRFDGKHFDSRTKQILSMAISKLTDVDSPPNRYDPRQMAQPLGPRTPSSVEDFINSKPERGEDVINVDDDEDENNNGNHMKPKRKLMDLEGPPQQPAKKNRIFTTKTPGSRPRGGNKPNFSSYDGSSR